MCVCVRVCGSLHPHRCNFSRFSISQFFTVKEKAELHARTQKVQAECAALDDRVVGMVAKLDRMAQVLEGAVAAGRAAVERAETAEKGAFDFVFMWTIACVLCLDGVCLN